MTRLTQEIERLSRRLRAPVQPACRRQVETPCLATNLKQNDPEPAQRDCLLGHPKRVLYAPRIGNHECLRRDAEPVQKSSRIGFSRLRKRRSLGDPQYRPG